MSVVINTNVDSLRIQNVLTNATGNLSKTMQRMSNGLKINQAKDDAAGTVISARMEVQLDGNKICQNNIQNANAMLSTTEGNIDVVLDNISRIRDLTLQAKNGTYSKEEKQAMQDEVSQRMAEIDRLSDSAKFSQLQLFGDTSDLGLAKLGATFQVGANSSDINTISIEGDTDGSSIFASIKFADLLKTDEVVTPEVNYTKVSSGSFNADNMKDNDAAINGGTYSASDVGKLFFSKATGKIFEIKATTSGETTTYSASQVEKFNFNANAYTEAEADPEDTDDGTFALGSIIKVGEVYKVLTAIEGGEDPEDPSEYTWKDISGATETADVPAVIAKSQTYATNDAFDLTTMVAGDETVANSFGKAINALDYAIDNLTARKASIGSLENRMDSALDTLVTQHTNLSSAKSIITDADIASEASYYTQQQILQQVSTSLLAQANQAPAIALSLI